MSRKGVTKGKEKQRLRNSEARILKGSSMCILKSSRIMTD